MKLHLGCGDLRFLGWVNLDLKLGHDLRLGLRWPDSSIEAVYSCHFLEHLSFEEGQALLREIHRVLLPGAVLRVGVPDFALFARAYVEGDESFSRRYFENYCQGTFEPAEDPTRFSKHGPIGGLLAIVYGWGHRAAYDERVLRDALQSAGFSEGSIHRCDFGKSHYYGQCELDQRYEDHTLFMEAEKSDSGSGVR